MLKRIPRQLRARRTTGQAPEPDDPRIARRLWLHDISGLRHKTPLTPYQLSRLQAELRRHLPTASMIITHLEQMGVEVIVVRSPKIMAELKLANPEAFDRLIRALSHRREQYVQDAIQAAISPHPADAVRPFR